MTVLFANPYRSIRLLWFACALILWASPAVGLEAAQADPTEPEPSAAVEAEAPNEGDAHTPRHVDGAPAGDWPHNRADEDAKRLAVSIGMFGLMGIVVLGLGLLLLVILWGHRLRRISRTPSPKATLGDELWYLRPNKQKSAEQSNPPSENPPPNSQRQRPDDSC